MTRVAEEVMETMNMNGGVEYEVEDVRDKIESSRGSRFQLIEDDLGLNLFRRRISRLKINLSQGFIIHPELDFSNLINFFLSLVSTSMLQWWKCKYFTSLLSLSVYLSMLVKEEA